MAEAFFNHLARGRAIACSAGTQPAERVDPHAVLAMREVDIDIAAQIPQAFIPGMLEELPQVISMGCEVDGSCLASSVSIDDWGIEDPKGKSMEQIRGIRDKIRARVIALLEEIKE